MTKIFKIIPRPGIEKDSTPLYSIGIQLKIGSQENIVPITGELHLNELETEVKSIADELDELLKKAKKTRDRGGAFNIDENSSPEEIWTLLSAVPDNDAFRDYFNDLEEGKRKELAAYILENCNIFTGKGAYFSARYIQETGLIE